MLGRQNTADPALPLTVETTSWPGQTAWYLLDANGDAVAVRCELGLVTFTGPRHRVRGLKRSLEKPGTPGVGWKDGEIISVHPHIDLM